MMRIAAEGQERSKINAALGSLGLEQERVDDSSQYCIKTSVAFVKKIIEEYGTNINEPDDDDIITAGVFLFVISNHITRVIGAPFEIVSAITPLMLFSNSTRIKDIPDLVSVIIDTYNGAAENTKITDAIGQNFVKYLDQQEYSQFRKIVELYGICRESISDS